VWCSVHAVDSRSGVQYVRWSRNKTHIVLITTAATTRPSKSGTSQKPRMSFILRSFYSQFSIKLLNYNTQRAGSPTEGPCFDISLDQRPRTEFQVHFMTKRERLTMHNTTQLFPRTTGCVVHATGIVCIVSLIAS